MTAAQVRPQSSSARTDLGDLLAAEYETSSGPTTTDFVEKLSGVGVPELADWVAKAAPAGWLPRAQTAAPSFNDRHASLHTGLSRDTVWGHRPPSERELRLRELAEDPAEYEEFDIPAPSPEVFATARRIFRNLQYRRQVHDALKIFPNEDGGLDLRAELPARVLTLTITNARPEVVTASARALTMSASGSPRLGDYLIRALDVNTASAAAGIASAVFDDPNND